MKKIKLFLALAIIICFSINLSAQKISKIDFNEIQKETTDNSSSFYYPNLLKRFLEFDTTLTPLDYKYIYFGNVYFDKYSPYGTKGEKEFMVEYRNENYEEAITLGENILTENPICLEIIYKVAVCHNRLKDKKMTRKYANMYYSLLKTIYESGDGKSAKTAYVVVKVSDEYEILKDLELQTNGQALIGKCDKHTFDVKKQKNRPKKKRIKMMYFNVEFPLGHLMKILKKDD